MATERDLLSDLRSVLGSADVDAGDLVEQAWADARDEVYATLKRLMVNDLLTRALGTLGGQPSVAAPGATDERDPEPVSMPTLAATDPITDPDQRGGTEPELATSDARAMTYLFAIVGPDAELAAGEWPSLPGGSDLRFIDGPGCRALVSHVAPELFEVLREPGPDGLDLLAAAAHAHDQILARFAGSPVLPLGLGTAFVDDAAVSRLLTLHGPRLRDELARIGDQAEWAVTVHAFEAPEQEDTSSDTPETGRDYLRQRRAARDQREGRWEHQDRLASELHGPLAACAVEAQRVESRPLEDGAPPLLHGVYLLDEASRGRFESTVTYLRTEYPDAVVEVSGPWPPYHFVSLNLAADGEPST